MTTPRTRGLPDQADRDRIRTSLDETLVVEAAAGTGKTTALIARIVATLAHGRAEMASTVAVTFTEKAAGELKLRLREALERARGVEHEAGRRARLDGALAHLEDAHISTIHGFCADLLRERPLEAGVDPRFEVLMESASAVLLDEAFARWLRVALEAPGEGVRRVLRRRYRGDDTERGPVGELRQAAGALAAWRDFPAPWRRDPFDRVAEVLTLLRHLHDVAARTAAPLKRGDNLYVDTESLRRFCREHADVPVDPEPHEVDALESALVDLSRDRTLSGARAGYGSAYSADVSRADLRQALSGLREAVETFAARANADLAACVQQELQPCLVRYEALKRDRGVLDFVDLLVRARDLLVGHPQVRAHFQHRFARIFVDEFQDTDPLQAEILLLLCAGDADVVDWERVAPVPGKLFVVGDPKQAIYRFRRADVGTYWRVKALLLAQPTSRLCHLSACFRLVPSLQHAINQAFEPVMQGQSAEQQADYVALQPVRVDADSQPALVALPVPYPYGPRNVSGKAIEASLPHAVGAYVAWLVTDSGWTVAEDGPDGTEVRVPLQARHVALLFRRFVSWGEDVTRPYVDALEARGVPHLLVGGRSFHAREEVDAVRLALAAVEWPDDELSVYGALRGLLFGLPDHTLLAWRTATPGHRLDPFRLPEPRPDGEAGEVYDALHLLRQLHRDRNRLPAHATLQHLLRETRAHASLVLRPGGEQALANVLHMVELARQYDTSSGLSFRGFVTQLGDQRFTEAAEAPMLEEGTDGVRVMTVHKAKGLEFPVVVLADITCGLTGRAASRHLDPVRRLCAQPIVGCAPRELLEQGAVELARDRAESHRLAYVAATRARDLLVVPAVGDAPYPGPKHGERWVDVLNVAIYPLADARSRPSEAPGCPSFGRDSVMARPDGGLPLADTVRPGQFMLGEGAKAYPVVWWDPQSLQLDAELTFGARQLALVDRQAPGAHADQGRAEYDQWAAVRRDTAARGADPSFQVNQVTQASGAHVGSDALARVEVRAVLAARDVTRPSGRRFGTLVHDLLALVPLDATADTVQALASLRSRVHAADAVEQAAAVEVLAHVLADPLLRRAAAAADAGKCRREWPVQVRVGPRETVEGVLDLAFEDDSGWTVVDFKTDAVPIGESPAYRVQAALYAQAVARTTGRPATAVILQV
jgi:ATP-dependent helicase/nuclease subunit A